MQANFSDSHALELDLPRVAQTLDHTCGAACFESMFRYFKREARGELHFAHELDTLKLGYTPPLHVAQLAERYGFRSALREGLSLFELREAFASAEVVFVTWWDVDAAHYSLIKSLGPDFIILMDPWLARQNRDNRMSLEEFLPYWTHRGAKVIQVSRQ